MNEIVLYPIGIVHSPFKHSTGTPIQSGAAKDVGGTVELFEDYSIGLRDLEGFSHIILIYYFHQAKAGTLLVTPFMDHNEHGVFATRAPSRPNPIGLSIVRLVRVKLNTLFIKGMDILDGTPLLDIKPYVPQIDIFRASRIGWLGHNIVKLSDMKDDGRFSK